MATCKFCGAAISWRQQGFKWIPEANGGLHNCVPKSPVAMEARRRDALDQQATRLLAAKSYLRKSEDRRVPESPSGKEMDTKTERRNRIRTAKDRQREANRERSAVR